MWYVNWNVVMWHLPVDDMYLWKPKYVRSLQITVSNILSTLHKAGSCCQYRQSNECWYQVYMHANSVIPFFLIDRLHLLQIPWCVLASLPDCCGSGAPTFFALSLPLDDWWWEDVQIKGQYCWSFGVYHQIYSVWFALLSAPGRRST